MNQICAWPGIEVRCSPPREIISVIVARSSRGRCSRMNCMMTFISVTASSALIPVQGRAE